MSDNIKKWGHADFWGLGSDFDPDWLLTEKQRELQKNLIELCRTKIRPNAAKCDKEYIFPRESLDSLASLGLFGLIAPKRFGGMEETHVCALMVLETIARYGCPSTALVFCMHLVGLSMSLFGIENNPTIQDIIKRINKDKLLMTSVHSDPATGGHFWYPFTSKMKEMDENTVRLFKYGSWVTSSGYADLYIICTTSPGFKGDYSDMTITLCFRDEIRAFTQDWSALGMHGNMSSEIVVDELIPRERVISKLGHGGMNNDECGASFFNITSAGCWNGISMACLDIAKKYLTRKSHGDVGLRICDYPGIQTYFGECVSSTTMCRLSSYQIAKRMDEVTNNNDYSLVAKEPFSLQRKTVLFWLMQLKLESSKNASEVSTTMLRACGGVGYKSELGIERLFRDAQAGQLMAVSNEICKIVVGKVALLGPESIDFWGKTPNKGVINYEVAKLSPEEKKKLAQTLLKEAEEEENPQTEEEPEDFDNPFNRTPTAYLGEQFKENGITYMSALNPNAWKKLALSSTNKIDSKTSAFEFSLPVKSNHSGLIAGQYIKARVTTKDSKSHERYFSPVSVPSDQEKLQLVLRFESHGIVSEHFQKLSTGSSVEFKGPCGGFEYLPSTLQELTLITAGGAVTPALQIIRTIVGNEKDKTKCNLLYYSNTAEEILFREELEGYNKNDSRINICFTVGDPPLSWAGEEGFIDDAMIGKTVSKDTSRKHKIVICGGVNMCLTCCAALKTLGYQSNQIFVFGHFGAEVVKNVFGQRAELTSQASG